MSDVTGPRQPGYYKGRLQDCKAAVEPIYLEMIENHEGDLPDTDTLTQRISPAAAASGWAAAEVSAAVLMLQRQRMPRQRRARQR
jgi:hypothetical protein